MRIPILVTLSIETVPQWHCDGSQHLSCSRYLEHDCSNAHIGSEVGPGDIQLSH